MRELDVVKLNKEFKGLKAGTEGTIVLEYDGNYFEVEFFDDSNDTIGAFYYSDRIVGNCKGNVSFTCG